ncbi:50S ribosomal protein L29 [Robiginitalea sediminis]|uniref:50S ribosomal protein L29 n=1 Tax=Robiginitalea sediminis TaxID=1982593 RepID=UPI000B4B1577|nr:50S ribosomal protein L29 [Robiginitalea sediminis]
MKQSEIREMSVTELKEKLDALKQQYGELKMAHAVTPLENPLQLRSTRRTVARLATELIKREENQ